MTTATLSTPSSSSAAAAPAPPAPGFGSLVWIHLRLLVGEFPVAWFLFGGLLLLIPVAALLAPLPQGAVAFTRAFTRDDPAFPLTLFLVTLTNTLPPLVILVSLAWPDAVWRNLRLGAREPVDALPVSRRVHRMARVAAGAVLPAMMVAWLAASDAIFQMRGMYTAVADASRLSPGALGIGGEALPGILLTALLAYAMGSAVGIRFGKVIVVFVVAMVGLWAVLFAASLLELDGFVQFVDAMLVRGDWAPVGTLARGITSAPAELAPVVLWLVAFTGLATWWAGRHDRA
jgi:hypothetical protein